MTSKKKVNWEGSFFIEHSLAKVNREICKRLINENNFEIGTIPYEQDSDFIISDDISIIKNKYVNKDGWANITICHRWPPNFHKPQSDKWILFQPWENGAIPRDWYIPMKYWVDEIWVYSTSNKEAYIRSGIPGEKIKVIPLGVDEDIFHLNVKPMELKTKKSFRFLFVGGTIFRKGIDTLLKAYMNEFTADDDVCLVIKDYGNQSFYKGTTMGEWIAEYQKNTQNPEIIYMDEIFSPENLACLYKACNCLVHPYRGEGFGLPIIESMACGLPAIVPSLGPSLDFCNEDTAFFLPCKEEKWPIKKIGDMETVDHPWWIKVEENDLRKMMRYVYNNQELVEEKGREASKVILSTFTWNKSAKAVSSAIEQILGQKTSDMLTDENIVISEMKSAENLLLQNPSKAMDIYDNSLDSLPNSIGVRYQKAMSYVLQKDYAQALTQLYYIKDNMQEESKEYQSEIWNSIGVCLIHLREFMKAHEAFHLAVSLDPSNSEFAMECYKVILENTERSIIPSETADFYLFLGTIYFEFGNDFEAEKMYNKALALDPQRSEIMEKITALKKNISYIKETYVQPSKDMEINDVKELYHRIAHLFEGDELTLRERRKQWVHYFHSGDKVLDIGCGNGFFMEMLEKAGVDTVGIEFDQQMVKQDCAKGLNIQQKRAEDFLSNKKEVYDGIFLRYIIEHLAPQEVLNLLIQCTKALKPHGKIIILTSNIGNILVNETSGLDIPYIRPYPRLLMIHLLQSLGLYVKESQLLEDEREYSVVAQKNCYELIWDSPVLNLSGYAEEQKSYLNSLKPFPLKIKIVGDEQSKPEMQPPKTINYLKALRENQLQYPLIHYQAGPAYGFCLPKAPISIGRTMFETDTLPNGWLNRMQNLTEIWVPSEFNKKTFCTAGLDEKKVFILPGVIDEEKYNPQKVKPYKLKSKQSFHFLSVFDWSLRKGWDILIQAFLEEFNEDENVTLVLKVYKMLDSQCNPHEDIFQITKRIGERKIPNIELIDSFLTSEEMIELYAAADSFVLPSRGEGWGRPYMEAMAMGLPTIGTRWSAQVDFMNDDNSYLIEIEKLSLIDQSMPFFYHGHRWAQPSVDHLKKLMRKIYENQDEAKNIGNKARDYILSNYSQEKVAKMIYQRLDELVKRHYS